jgi:hypothetical protein
MRCVSVWRVCMLGLTGAKIAQAYLRAKKDFQLSVPDGGGHGGQQLKIAFEKDELVAIERSYKYTRSEVDELLSRAALREVDHWTDGQGYYLFLVERPPFHFPSTALSIPVAADGPKSVNPFGIPTRTDWENLWKAWDTVTLGMVKKESLHTKPIDLR